MQRPTIVICSGNPGKKAEFRELLPSIYEVRGLEELGMPIDLPETGNTFEDNALQKARYVFDRTRLPCLADDSGLEVDALDGAPGVYSARFAGPEKDSKANMALLLEKLGRSSQRSARFRTVLAYVDAEGARCFDGVVEGSIATHVRGTGGFGYDPIFRPSGEERTFAEMPAAEKNAVSHRAKAMKAFLEDLLSRASDKQ